MHPTYEQIIQDCVAEALLLPRDPLQTEIRNLALGAMNEAAHIIWLAWKWDNEKVDEFTAPAAVNGIITFGSTVESIMAVKKSGTGASSTSTHIWSQDEYLAAINGETVSSDRFQHLAADSSLNRRILVPVETPAATYTVLALRKYTRATVETAYSSVNPTATPTDYRVQTFVIDRAEPALRSAVKDSLRGSQGLQKDRTFKELLNLALARETYDNGRERRANPKSPMFSEVGEWNEYY